MWRPSVASVELACVDLVWRLTFGTPAVRGALPEQLAGVLVEAHHQPAMRGRVLNRRDVAVEADLQLGSGFPLTALAVQT